MSKGAARRAEAPLNDAARGQRNAEATTSKSERDGRERKGNSFSQQKPEKHNKKREKFLKIEKESTKLHEKEKSKMEKIVETKDKSVGATEEINIESLLTLEEDLGGSDTDAPIKLPEVKKD